MRQLSKMDITEQINRLREFLELYYYEQLLEKVRTDSKSLEIDFNQISSFDPVLAEMILEQPDEIIRAFEVAAEQLQTQEEVKPLKIRMHNLPPSQKLLIRNIRSEHMEQLIFLDGVVRQKSDVRPQVTSARFECPSCGNIIPVLQTDSKFKEPSRCSCGRKGKFRLVHKELVDAQGLVLEEATEDLEGGEQPKRMNVFLKSDLVSPMHDKKTNPGAKICVVGVIKEVPIILRTGGQSTNFELMIEANNAMSVQEDYYDIEIDTEEEKQIKDLSKDPKVIEKLRDSMAPSIFGHEIVKEALLMQLAGGVRKKRDDGAVTRGDIHILLIGDPGAGKSQLLKRMTIAAPKARYVSGKGVSGAGLTASVVKDEFLRGWALEAGALVLANMGLCCIDEFDKMTPDDRAAMHEALEQQSVTISKANVQATLRAETTVLAAANPKFGRFDPYETISKQINLPPTLINRFDLIFPIRDLPDQKKDEHLANFILTLHQNPNAKQPIIETKILKKYISYARRTYKPVLSNSALTEIQDYYVKMRGGSSNEGELSAVPISPRQLEALVRLSEARARLRFSNRVTKKDARSAIELLHHCLAQVGLDPETGKIDIDRITTGITTSERSKIVQIREIITTLEETFGKAIPIDEIKREAQDRGLSEDTVDESIEKLKRSGDVYEPKRDVISRL